MDPFRGDFPSHNFHHHPPPPPPSQDSFCCSDDEEENYPAPPPFPPPHQASHFPPSLNAPDLYFPAHHTTDPYLPHQTADPYLTHQTADPYISSHKKEPAQPAAPGLPQGHIVKIFCKGNPSFNLAVQRNGVIMVPANSEDEAQQWVKDVSYGMRVKDNYGHPAFSLVNKATSKVLKHEKEKGQQVLLMDYRPDIRDDDILWSESQDFGEGFKTVRSASDTLLNLTVFEGNKKIRNGSALVLDTWHQADHQLWKVFPL